MVCELWGGMGIPLLKQFKENLTSGERIEDQQLALKDRNQLDRHHQRCTPPPIRSQTAMNLKTRRKN